MAKKTLPAVGDLARSVKQSSPDPLAQLDQAVRLAEELGDIGNDLVAQFVKQARDSGLSWAAIGDHFGVSKQAVQQRFQLIEQRAAQRSQQAAVSA